MSGALTREWVMVLSAVHAAKYASASANCGHTSRALPGEPGAPQHTSTVGSQHDRHRQVHPPSKKQIQRLFLDHYSINIASFKFFMHHGFYFIVYMLFTLSTTAHNSHTRGFWFLLRIYPSTSPPVSLAVSLTNAAT